eukprot:jgi/Psemu1/21994/gm1.21994_g
MEFSSSAKEEFTTVCHPPSQYGLTLTKNGPIPPSAAVAAAHNKNPSSNQNFNSLLNSQVIHNLFVPPIDRNLIESQLFPSEDNNNNGMVIHEEICLPIHNDNDMNAMEPIASQPHINEREQLIQSHVYFSPLNRLIAEIKLMNLMTKHKLPLNTFKSIFQWANECQNIYGVDFSTTFPRIDARNKIVFPNMETPLSPEDNPPITNKTYIIELHHSSWWTDSWKQIYKEEGEILHEVIGSKLPLSLSVDRDGNNISVDDSSSSSSTSIMTPNAGRHVSDELKVKIKLMKIMQNHSIPFVAEKELYEWAIKSKRLNLFSWTKGNLIQKRSRVMREIYATVPEIEGDGFEPQLIDWCYKKSICADVSGCKQIYVQSFQKALHSLLTNVTLVKEENLSFPHAEDPTLPVWFPKLQGNIDIDKLHHGEWWINTCKMICKRDSNEILETIYFHPTGSRDKGDKLIDNVNNLHSGLCFALSSLKNACNLTDGDTPQHDHLCGHYQTANTKMICRHCNCPRALGNNSRVNVLNFPISIKSGNMQMSDFTAPMVEEGVNVEQYFKKVSHHRVHNSNTFCDLGFGENPHNIHPSSPGERLHMHQLGCARQAAETFHEELLGNNTQLFAKKEGNQYIGMLYIQMLVVLLSAEGCQLLLSQQTSTKVDNQRRKCEDEIDRYIYAIELLLGMEEFLKYAGTFDEVFKEDKKGVLNLDKMVVCFITCINNYLQQSKGEGNNGVKNHLYFHISQYMRLFGPPMGWDSTASDSNHKTKVKDPMKRTQQIKSTLIKQTCKQFMEHHSQSDKKQNASVPWFPPDVLKFCCNMVLPAAGISTLHGSTEHKKYGNYHQMGFPFCAHPLFKSDSGQLSNIWYDWENFQLDFLDERGLQAYPCQILCLLHLEGPFPPGSSREKAKRDRHALVKQDVLRNKLYLFDCNVIKSEVAVVRNLGKKDHYFVLRNREQWLFHFCDTMAGLEKQKMESIVKAGESCTDL